MLSPEWQISRFCKQNLCGQLLNCVCGTQTCTIVHQTGTGRARPPDCSPPPGVPDGLGQFFFPGVPEEAATFTPTWMRPLRHIHTIQQYIHTHTIHAHTFTYSLRQYIQYKHIHTIQTHTYNTYTYICMYLYVCACICMYCMYYVCMCWYLYEYVCICKTMHV
jgi:hypothetical protein